MEMEVDVRTVEDVNQGIIISILVVVAIVVILAIVLGRKMYLDKVNLARETCMGLTSKLKTLCTYTFLNYFYITCNRSVKSYSSSFKWNDFTTEILESSILNCLSNRKPIYYLMTNVGNFLAIALS